MTIGGCTIHNKNNFNKIKNEEKKDKISEIDLCLIEQLRELVKDDLTVYYNTNFNLLRWIQGYRELSLKEVAKKLRFHLKMRKSCWDLDNMACQPRKHAIHYYWKHGITGHSKVLDNVIVNIEQVGQTDYKGLLKTYSIQEILKARTQDLEKMLYECMELEVKTGRQASILFVMDLKGLKYDKALFSLIRGSMRALSDFMATHYVEMIHTFLIVNAPPFICVIWNFTKPILPERTQQKVRILSSTNWREQVLEFAVPQSLPMQWNQGDGFTFQATLEQPTPYPIENHALPLNINNAEKIKINAGKTYFDIKELKKNDILKWLIYTESDFGMGVFFSSNKDENNIEKMEIAYPWLEWMPGGPTECPLNDSFKAKKDGFYKICLSNQHAWWTTLIVHACITVQTTDCLT